ncbi:Hypothetical_protein [Hexamita inflata]|uniref:Hypothetical_protein n=1 Tax=Hexamita inflata TaxID=28002 RepID=A0AA86QJG4_9EUKA|nr:Hypothetical protein HINF_LOCUS40450 [Hexamita inflata]
MIRHTSSVGICDWRKDFILGWRQFEQSRSFEFHDAQLQNPLHFQSKWLRKRPAFGADDRQQPVTRLRPLALLFCRVLPSPCRPRLMCVEFRYSAEYFTRLNIMRLKVLNAQRIVRFPQIEQLCQSSPLPICY